MKPSYILTSEFVTIVYNGKPQTVGKDDIRYPKILEIIRSGTWQNLPNVLETKDLIKNLCCGRVEVIGETVTFGGKVMNNCLTQRIVEFVREDIPFEPLVKFMDKLMDNPSNRSVEQLYSYLELYKLPITEDGDFIAMKNVKSNMTDHHTGTIDNSVGKVIEMPRNEVSDDPNCACHAGLHVGAEAYVTSFNRGGTVILCKINPRDVVSIPHDSSCQKMRVCRYEVINIVGDATETKAFDSNYAPENVQVSPKVMPSEEVSYKQYTNIGSDRAFRLYKMGHEIFFDHCDYGLNNVENTDTFVPHRSWFREFKGEFYVSNLAKLENND